jgi:mono/diheme cytochrome c family protein
MVLTKTTYFFSIVLFSAAWIACGSQPAASSTDPITPEQAKTLFVRKCATCHGTEGNMEIGGAKNLWYSALSLEEITAQITYGKGTMPPFGEILSEKEIAAIAEHTFGLRKKQ